MHEIIGAAGCAALGFLSAVSGVGLLVLVQKTLAQPCRRLLDAAFSPSSSLQPSR